MPLSPPPLSRMRLALVLALAGVLTLFSPAAFAEDGAEGDGGDIKKKIQAKMEKILELMRENEAALLKLSTGNAASTKKVDVGIPEGSEAPGTSGQKSGDKSGEAGASGSTGSEGARGESAAKEMEKLLETVSKKGGAIPDELKQLVEMIPL